MIFVPVADFTAVCTSLSGSIACVAPRASFGIRIGSPVFVVVSAADIRRARPSFGPRRVRAKTMSLSSRRAGLVGGQTRRERRASARARVGARSPMTAQYRAVFASRPGRDVAPTCRHRFVRASRLELKMYVKYHVFILRVLFAYFE